MEKVKMILIGAGMRGTAYVSEGKKYCPEMEVIAVADTNPIRCKHIQDMFGFSDEHCYKSAEEILEQPKMADIAIIAVQDKQHYDVAMKAIEKGYDLLLEKPIAPTPEECVAIEKAANAKGVKVLVCHVLRFTPFFMTIKKIIDSGKIGKVMNIVHVEGVGYLHYSHSYTRGDWRNTTESSPMILAKSCHDIDIIQWLIGEKCEKVHSFGSLDYFCSKNKPEGAPEFCVDGCPHEENCPYSAIKLYRERKVEWFAVQGTKMPNPSKEDIEKLIRETNYGRCVFQCDNNVVDHQVVNMTFAGGATASFTMSAFNKSGRRIRIMGTEGELEGIMGNDYITVYDFLARKYEQVPVIDNISDDSIAGGHGGGDAGIVYTLCQMMTGKYTGNNIADITTSVENHLATFAAEKSRLTDTVISMDSYRKSISKLI